MYTGSGSLRHRPFLTPIWLTVLAAFLGFLFVAFAAVAVWDLATSVATSVIVIREDVRPSLLARMFGDKTSAGRLDAIYVSRTAYGAGSVTPLAAALNLTPVLATADDPKALARRALREHAGGRVLIVSDAVTVPALVAQLSGNTDIPAIGESEYGTMYIVTVPRIGHANMVRLTY